MNSNFLLSLVFAGIIQGIFLGVFILTSKKHKSKASLYLGLLILCFTLSNLQNAAYEIELVSGHTFNLIYLPYIFFTPPFLYFFVVNYLNPERLYKRVELLLYAPAVASVIITFTHKAIALKTTNTDRENSFLELLVTLIDGYGDFVNVFLFLTIIVSLLIKINNYEKERLLSKVTILQNQLLWLKILLTIILTVLIPWFIFTYIYFFDHKMFYTPMYVITSLVIYLLGYIGIHKIGILNERKKIKSYLKEHSDIYILEKPKSNHIAQIEKIVIENRKYLDPNISLDALSEELQLSKSHLSRIINAELNTSFTDYINSLRVSEAKKLLLNSDFSNYTLVAIGLESGFNSKTTFNTVFKKLTNQTPSQFRKNHTN